MEHQCTLKTNRLELSPEHELKVQIKWGVNLSDLSTDVSSDPPVRLAQDSQNTNGTNEIKLSLSYHRCFQWKLKFCKRNSNKNVTLVLNWEGGEKVCCSQQVLKPNRRQSSPEKPHKEKAEQTRCIM